MMQLRPGTAKQIISSLKERSTKLKKKKKKKNLRVPLLFNSLNELKSSALFGFSFLENRLKSN